MANSVSQNSVKFHTKKNSKLVSALVRVIKILEKFINNYEKRLNFTKLASYLELNPSELDLIIALILSFQGLFTEIFNTYIVKKKIIDNQIFLITEPKTSHNCIPKKIKLSSSSLNLLSDVTYMFKFVKRGKGFKIKADSTELLSNIKELWNYHPYFFEANTNGLMYLSEFGLKLGELILSYKKSGKIIESIPLDDHIIMVDKN